MSLSVRRDGAATWITLDRPEALNALDGPTKEELVGALRTPPRTRASGRSP